MNIWHELGIFVLGCFVGANVGILILALCKAAGDADRLIEKQMLERYKREKKEAESSRLTPQGGAKADG